jgi:hypothetical protein
MTRPTVSARPIGPEQVEVRTSCRHGAYRVGYQLDADLTERGATCAAIFHHAVMRGCSCLAMQWRRYRTDRVPDDLDAMRRRFDVIWSGVEADQRRRGYAVLDWQAAIRVLVGEEAA